MNEVQYNKSSPLTSHPFRAIVKLQKWCKEVKRKVKEGIAETIIESTDRKSKIKRVEQWRAD
jgi:hypothetical protein